MAGHLFGCENSLSLVNTAGRSFPFIVRDRSTLPPPVCALFKNLVPLPRSLCNLRFSYRKTARLTIFFRTLLMSRVRQNPLLVFLLHMTQSILLRQISYLKAENTTFRSHGPKAHPDHPDWAGAASSPWITARQRHSGTALHRSLQNFPAMGQVTPNCDDFCIPSGIAAMQLV